MEIEDAVSPHVPVVLCTSYSQDIRLLKKRVGDPVIHAMQLIEDKDL